MWDLLGLGIESVSCPGRQILSPWTTRKFADIVLNSINILSNPGLKVLCISVTPAVELVSLDQKQITIHHLLFLSAYSRPGNLLNTLSILFPEPLSLGYDTAHCRVCWCEDSLPAGTCMQWPPSGDRLPHLELCPSLCPAHVSAQEASLIYCVSPQHPIHPSSLSSPPPHLPAIT